MSRYSAARGCHIALSSQRPATRRRDTATSVATRDTARAQGLSAGCVVIQACDTGGQAYDTAGQAYDTAGHKPTTLPAWAQPRPVRAGWVRVYTWCTQPSFDSVHYSESLFGTLFMSTVHEVLKKIKIN